VSTPDAPRTLITMDTENARVTRKEAARIAGVTQRTVNRWSAAGLITAHRPHGPWGPAEYDLTEVLRAAGMVDLALPVDDTA
jgi:hypothetical protein